MADSDWKDSDFFFSHHLLQAWILFFRSEMFSFENASDYELWKRSLPHPIYKC